MINENRAARVVETLKSQNKSISVAESLTGGGLASMIVSVPGASDVFRGGVVAYQPEVKTKVLGVSATAIHDHTTVCPEVVSQMAEGALALFDSDCSLATTGVAGPGPSEGHPAGTVYVSLVIRGERPEVRRLELSGDRDRVRELSCEAALELFCEYFDV